MNWYKIKRWFRSPIRCKFSFHLEDKTNIGYDLRARRVDFFCARCDKLFKQSGLDDSGAAKEVMEIKAIVEKFQPPEADDA